MNNDSTRQWAVLAVVGALYAAVLWPASPAGSADRVDPLSPPLRSIELALRDARPAEALQLAAAAAQQYPRDPFLKYLEATALQQLSRWEDEAKAWEAYIDLSDTPGAACPAVAVAHEQRGDDRRALEWWRRCVAIEPEEPERLVDLADALARRGLTREARDRYDQARVLDPGNPGLTHAIAGLGADEP